MSRRTKKVTSEQVVRVYIERCKKVNSLINAVVQERYIDAIIEAKAVDAMLEEFTDMDNIKTIQPFLGVPFTTKESNRADGRRHTIIAFAKGFNCIVGNLLNL